MNQANTTNLNTRKYWNKVYKNPKKYLAEQTGPTARFTTALGYVKYDDRVLDIGCGVGEFTHLVAETYPKAEVWGTDISDRALSDNRKRDPGIRYMDRTVGDLRGIPANYFDVVFAGEVLEHLDDPSQLFGDALHALRPGGLFILTTPYLDAIQTPEHTWTFSHQDIEDLYKLNGFTTPQFEYLPNQEHLMVIFAVGKKEASENSLS